jgi:hypothetical protein
MLKNVKFSYEGDILVLKIDLSKSLGVSQSGKSELVASTGSKFGVPLPTGETLNVSVFKPVGAGV